MLLLPSCRFVLSAEQSSLWESVELAVSAAECPGLFSATFCLAMGSSLLRAPRDTEEGVLLCFESPTFVPDFS
jgi:hypothetical protein